MGKIPDICQHLKRLKNFIQKQLIFVLISRHVHSNIQGEPLELPTKQGCVELVIYTENSKTTE